MLARVLRRLGVGLFALAALNSCSSGGDGAPVGIDNPVQAYAVQKMVEAFAGVAQTHLLLPIVLLPALHGLAGITFDLDTSPSAPPNTYDFSIPLDGDGDGALDTTIVGRAEFSADPLGGGVLVAGFSSSVDFSVTTHGGLEVFDGMLELYLDNTGAFRVSGTGAYTDAETGSSIDLSVAPAKALLIRVASDEPDQMQNACTWSIDGDVALDASGPSGDYSATWQFDPTTQLILALNALFTPPGGATEQLADSSFEAGPCPGAGSIDDWAGNFTFQWFCSPPEFGTSALSITVIDADTIEIVDEDPPASGDILVFQATRDPGNPHIVRGTFQEAEPGGTYEEDFTWVLAGDGQSFQQVSEYLFISGPFTGSGGDCGGKALRN